MIPQNPRIDQIARKAIKIAVPADRTRYLGAACGRDDLLRRQVEARLAAVEEALKEALEEAHDESREDAHGGAPEETREDDREVADEDAPEVVQDQIREEVQEDVQEYVRDDAPEVVQDGTREDDLENAHDESWADGRDDAHEQIPEEPGKVACELPAEISGAAPNDSPSAEVDSSVANPPSATTDNLPAPITLDVVLAGVQHTRRPVSLALAVAVVTLIGGIIGATLIIMQTDAARRTENEQQQITPTPEQEAIDAAAAALPATELERQPQDGDVERHQPTDARQQPAEDNEHKAAILTARNLADAGLELLKQKKWSEAETMLRQCLALHEKLAHAPRDTAASAPVPSWQIADAKSMLGEALTGQKQFAEAEPLLLAGYEGLTAAENAIPVRARSRVAESLQRLVRLYDAWEKPEEALRQRDELEGRSLAAVHNGRGWGAFARQDYERAIAEFSQAIESRPRFALAYNNRGLAWTAKGMHDRAIQDYSEAIRLDPEFAEMYRNRGSAWQAQGELDKALSDYAEAVRLDPQSAEGYNQRAWLHATAAESRLRDGSQAIADATKACELTEWRNATFLDTLAAAYAECGDFAQAVRWERQALALASPDLREELAARLELYGSGRPFREESPPAGRK